MNTQCAQCGSTNVTPGFMQGDHHRGFRPDSMPDAQAATGAKVSFTACLDCGAVNMWIDPAKVKALTGEKNLIPTT
jgi:hypothetical protein